MILDLVPNHTSDKHEWFRKSLIGEGKYKDYYVWKIGNNNNQSPPNNWISVFNGPAWSFNTNRNQWYLHQFEYRQPDLNYSNPDVRDEMKVSNIYKYITKKLAVLPKEFTDNNNFNNNNK